MLFENIGRGIARGSWWGMKKAAYPFYSNWIGRMMGGGIIGGVYGGITSDSNTSSGKFRDSLAGALGGVGLVGGTWAGLKLGRRGLERLGQGSTWKGLSKIGWGGVKAGWGAVKPILSYAAKHPLQVGLVGAGIAGGIGMYNRFQPNEPLSTNNISRDRLIGSTFGLVQGLNDNRHQ